MRVLAALGGNALWRRGEARDAEAQRRNLLRAAAALAELAREHTLVVTHGNGPQVGLLALQAEAYHEGPRLPLDVLGAESEGMIGYLLERELRNALPAHLDRPVATLLTQVVVEPDDPAFARPTKPIGPGYTREEAERLARERGWRLAQDGETWRRVVASPEPRRIVELATLEILLDAGVIVVCAGGGGIPVCLDEAGALCGVEAVIDKDLAAALLATELAADALLLLTDVTAVYEDWPRPAERPLGEVRASELARRRFDPGSMGPKVEAARRFVAATGGTAAIGRLEEARALLREEAGTRVLPG